MGHFHYYLIITLRQLSCDALHDLHFTHEISAVRDFLAWQVQHSSRRRHGMIFAIDATSFYGYFTRVAAPAAPMTLRHSSAMAIGE